MRRAFVDSSERQKIINQLPHPGRLDSDPPQRSFEVRRELSSPVFNQLRVRRNRRDGSSQFVARVSDEAPQEFFLLAQFILHPGTISERSTDLIEHPVEGP